MITSGTDVNMQLTSFPAEVSFTITDDDAALEPVERYTLSLTSSDPSITISQAEAEIVIIDDDSELRVNSVCVCVFFPAILQ